MRTSNRGTKYFYVVMIRNATVPKTHKEECPTHGLTEMGTNFNGTENFCERRRLRGSESLFFKKKHHFQFQHSQADSCVKMKFRKLIVIFFLALAKRALSSAVLYFHKYSHSYLQRGKEWIMHFNLLFIYDSRVYS